LTARAAASTLSIIDPRLLPSAHDAIKLLDKPPIHQLVDDHKGLLVEYLIRILNYTNETLIIIEGYRDRQHPILARTFILENTGRIEEFAKTYDSYIGTTTIRALCDEFRSLLEGEDHE
jgi:hypothetical protein